MLTGCDSIRSHFPHKKYIKPPKTNRSLNVAVLLPLSGYHHNLGKNILDGINLALLELKITDINCEIIDIGSTTEESKKIFDNIDLDKFQVLLGPVFKEDTIMIYEKARKKKLVIISYSNDMTLVGLPGLYLLDVICLQQVNEIFNYAMKQQGFKIYSIVSRNDYGDAIKAKLVDNRSKSFFNLKQMVECAHSKKLPLRPISLSQAILSIKEAIKQGTYNNSGATSFYPTPTILVPEEGKSLINILNQLQFLYSVSDKYYKVLGVGDWRNYYLTQNLVVKNAWIADIPHKSLYKFESRFKNQYGYVPIRLAAIAYDSIFLLSKIVYKTGNGVIIKLKEIEKQSGYQGVTGKFRLESSGVNRRLFSIFEYRNGIMQEISVAPRKFAQAKILRDYQ